MQELINHSFSLAAANLIKSHDVRSFGEIVGDFYTNQHHYLIIHLLDKLKSSSCKEKLIETIDFRLEVGRFEINQQVYIIVKADNTPQLNTSFKPNEVTQNKPNFVDSLTNRERQIVQLVALGQPNKRIAKQLQISEWTVSTHLRRIFAKLGVDSRAAMVYQCASLFETEST